MTEKNFESAFKRLEEIVDKINGGALPLEETLRLYEEAHHLILHCQSKLAVAEETIEILLKSRDQRIALNERGEPMKAPLETAMSV